jgi:hypothetical protein
VVCFSPFASAFLADVVVGFPFFTPVVCVSIVPIFWIAVCLSHVVAVAFWTSGHFIHLQGLLII